MFKIGPHEEHILSIFYGTLLGDSYLEKRSKNVRISFQQENKNVEYLMWLWNLLAISGYCTNKRPKLHQCIGARGQIRFYYRLNTYTFSSLNFLYDQFYKDGCKIKRVPCNIIEYLTPLALACWIMDDGGPVGSGIKLSTQGFLKEDVILLSDSFYVKWNIKCNLQNTGKINQWIIYIPKKEVYKVQYLVEPYMVKSMLYKIHK